MWDTKNNIYENEEDDKIAFIDSSRMMKKIQIIRTTQTVEHEITGKSRGISVLVNKSKAQCSVIGYEIFNLCRLILDAPLIIKMKRSIIFLGTIAKVTRQKNM
jgi:hypothetical protein